MTLDDLAEQLRRVGGAEMKAAVVDRAAKNLRAALEASLSAGTAPDGTPWAAKKKDGGRPYAKAASKLQVNAYGSVIRAAITGPEVFGHFGKKKTQEPRPMLPEGQSKVVDEAIGTAITYVLDEAFR